MPKVFFVFFCIFIFLNSNAQELTPKELADKYVKNADELYAFGDVIDAIDIYKLAIDAYPAHVKANFMTGKCYLESIHKPRGLKYFLKAYELDHNYDPNMLFYIAECFHYAHEFDNSIIYYEKHLTEIDKEKKAKTISKEDYDFELKDTQRKIYECKVGKELMDEPVNVEIDNLGKKVNSKYPEYTPAVSADESVLVYTSRRQGSTGGLKAEDMFYYEDIYISEKDEKGNWSKAENIGIPVNTEGHDAVISISSDAKEIFLYKDEEKGNIYKSKRNSDGTWSKPESFKVLNSPAYEGHITSTEEGDLFIFTSDRSGEGGIDLFSITKDEKGKWGKPINLGKTINTEYDEDSPFIDSDGSLFFSSKGHRGMGGHDIFKSTFDKDKKTWSEPINIGFPINTADDDLYFVMSGDGKHGYYSSFKDGGRGEKDLYIIDMYPPVKEEIVVELPEAEKIELVPDVVEEPLAPEVIMDVILKGNVKDFSNGNVIPNANIEIYNANDNTLIKSMQTDANGNYEYNFKQSSRNLYIVSAQKEDYIYKTEKVSVPDASTKTQIVYQNILLKQPIKVGENSPTYVLRNIYFDFDKSVILPISIVELEKLEKMLKNNPTWQVEIGGHTDDKGSDMYNKLLSTKRSQAVVKYLIMRGIASSRLIPKGYGEEKPIASNDDEKDGREINRRTEFKILSK